MKLRSDVVAVLACVVFVGCSGNDGKIEVDTASSAITDQGSDSLFTIELVEARGEGYAFEGMRVRVTPEGKDAFDAACKINDANVSSKLDKGDRLACSEPAENRVGRDLAGKKIEVELFAMIDGADERVGDASYDAK